MNKQIRPPRLADLILEWYCNRSSIEDLHGDVEEIFYLNLERMSLAKAKRKYWGQVFSLMFSYAVKNRRRKSAFHPHSYNSIHPAMIKSYFNIAARNLMKYKGYSFINIAGLAIGMAVALLIGLWILDEVSYDMSIPNHQRIAQVMQHQSFNGEVSTQEVLPWPIGDEIRSLYGNDFKHVAMATYTYGHILGYEERILTKSGAFFDPVMTEMLSLEMVKGTRSGLKDPYSIMLSESVATAYFDGADPIGKSIRIDNQADMLVTGVYKDFPRNSSFQDTGFIVPWDLAFVFQTWMKKTDNPWRPNSFLCYVEMAAEANINEVSEKIKDVKMRRIHKEEQGLKPEVFLFPMDKWHLYSKFENGKNVGGAIEFVWLFGLIGVFVLLLACINFMNLSTARSEKRAREVGIRKAIGSQRSQLVSQFFSESFLISLVSFALSLILVQSLIPVFNILSDKDLAIPWASPIFWTVGIGFTFAVGIVAGSYPALYLSSFQPVKVLKGTFKAGRLAWLPRKILVVVQFTVSVTLIIGTIIIFRQIEFGKNRPIGYTRDNLVKVDLQSSELHAHFDAIREELIKSGAIVDMAESSAPTTAVWSTNSGFEWRGKDPNLAVDFPNNGVSYDYGNTIQWKIKAGRDFSRDFKSDTAAYIINESAAKFMGLTDPVGEILTWRGQPCTIIGVIQDMIVQSPYNPVRPSTFYLSRSQENVLLLKLSPEKSSAESLSQIETVFKKYSPSVPFEYQFTDDAYAKKFANEERIGKLATLFAVLAILISLLGIFGLASFVAEQRTREIGIRKIHGASILKLWGMLSKDFIALVFVSFIIACPLAYYSMDNWLQRFNYRTEIAFWIFAVSGLGALVITLGTVSFQSIRAARANPVNSLRTE